MIIFACLFTLVTSFLFLISPSLINCFEGGLDCFEAPDSLFNGSSVDCTNRNLTQHDLRKLPFHVPTSRVTSLDISYNDIGYLPDNIFERFQGLKFLKCTWCNLDGIGKHALNGLGNLEILYLDWNRLDMTKGKNNETSIPNGAFRYVRMLKELYIDHNGFYDIIVSSGYSEYLDIFDYLPNLTYLTIDSFKNLVIGHEFLKFPELYYLSISCKSLRIITNDSLEGFRNSSLKMFQLKDGNSLIYTVGLDAFQNLPDVSYLSLKQVRLGNQNVLFMMKPLVRRNIETILFHNVKSPDGANIKTLASDTFITLKDAQYLREIRVSHFYWYNSGVYDAEDEALFSLTWRNTLKSFVVETDAQTHTTPVLGFRAMLLKEIYMIAYSWKNNGLGTTLFGDTWTSPSRGFFVNEMSRYSIYHAGSERNKVYQRKLDFSSNTNSQSFAFSNHPDFIPGHQWFLNQKLAAYSVSDIKINNQNSVLGIVQNDQKSLLTWFLDIFLQNTSSYIPITGNRIQFMKGQLRIRIPPKLDNLIVDSMGYLELGIATRGHPKPYPKDKMVVTVCQNKLRSVAVSNTQGNLVLHWTIYGLENVTSFSLKGSRALDMNVGFLDRFTGLKHLDLSGTSESPMYYHANSKRVIEKLTNLEYFNLGNNDLQRLPDDMFSTNNLVKYICLSKNRLSRIPFRMELTPALETLDLAGNSFIELSVEERAAIDNHILSVANFYIFLGDNLLSCSCSQFSFIDYMDIKAFWRMCNGRYYLMISIIGAFSLLASYLAMVLVTKKKTEIISSVMRFIAPGFKLSTRQDYQYDVFIGYADQDVSFVRNGLLRYLEGKWNLRTFVHQRDLRQDPVEMSDALRDSWRCLLLVTKDFLYHYDMAHNVMKVATFLVSPFNPGNIVLLVEEGVRHQVPDYILRVVDEDNIIVLMGMDSALDYETKEFLRTRLT